jgi:hypothetical protein
MNAPTFCWNGASSVCAPATGVQVLTKVFTVSGTYMPSPGLVSVVVETLGAGGGGGSCEQAGPLYALSAGGGGSGGYSRKTLPASLVAGGVAVTIGAGGVSNQPGGVTSFGALCLANGGSGAGTMASTGFGGTGGGLGAHPGVGDVAFPGTTGQSGVMQLFSALTQIGIAGGLGGTVFGGNATENAGPGAVSQGWTSYNNTGAGGGGALSNQAPANANAMPGGTGGSGVCIVTEYCWADVVPNEDCTQQSGAARVALEAT